ncbi:unnamed protein product [Boreogadus saida]
MCHATLPRRQKTRVWRNMSREQRVYARTRVTSSINIRDTRPHRGRDRGEKRSQTAAGSQRASSPGQHGRGRRSQRESGLSSQPPSYKVRATAAGSPPTDQQISERAKAGGETQGVPDVQPGRDGGGGARRDKGKPEERRRRVEQVPEEVTG